jgi:hypothetical protein
MVCKASLTKSSRLSGSASNIPSIRINFLLLSFSNFIFDGAPRGSYRLLTVAFRLPFRRSDADGGESYVIANSGRLPQSKLSSRLAASMQYVRASTQAFQLILLTEATATEAKLPERNEVETWPTHRELAKEP